MSTNPPSTQREILEAALAADSDDGAAHAAYADLLTEEGDARGEYIRVQLALETAPEGPERDALRAREQELLCEHIEQWLGTLAGPLLDTPGTRFGLRRGWLDEIEVPSMRADLAELIAAAPETRLLRRLAVIDPDAPELDPGEAYQTHVLAGSAWFDEDEETALVPLLSSPYLGNLRTFQLGDHEHERCGVGDGPVAELIEKMPRLEELHLFLWKLDEAERIFVASLPRLKVLRVGGVFGYPITALAGNTSLGALEDLMLQPASPGGHGKLWPDECAELVRSPHLAGLRHLRLPFLAVGDEVCEALAAGGLLGRLRTLELTYSQITDTGAAALTASPGLAALGHLALTGNHISPQGIERLQATGVPLVWEPQTEPEESGTDESETGEEIIGEEELPSGEPDE
jgi:uncharacterized protein (TIGR02996 family)